MLKNKKNRNVVQFYQKYMSVIHAIYGHFSILSKSEHSLKT